jgi:hypothetical protein
MRVVAEWRFLGQITGPSGFELLPEKALWRLPVGQLDGAAPDGVRLKQPRQSTGRQRLAEPLPPRGFVKVVESLEQRGRGDPVRLSEHLPDVGEQLDAVRLVLDLAAPVELDTRRAGLPRPVAACQLRDREERLDAVERTIVELVGQLWRI